MKARPTIAVVDDDEYIQKSLRRLLGSAGFEIESFASAEDFMASVQGRSYDCLILDVRMPGQSGIELHQQLIHHGHSMPTVFITAHEDELSRARRVTSQVVAYLRKPFDPDELLRAVQRAAADSETSRNQSENDNGT